MSTASRRLPRALALAACLAFWASGCAELAEPPAGAAADTGLPDARGVEADFGVASFALSTPTLTIVAPPHLAKYTKIGSQPTPVDVAFTVEAFAVGPGAGKVLCRLDGGSPQTVYTSPATIADLGNLGLHAISCVLASPDGKELADKSARFTRYVQVSQDPADGSATCTGNLDCDDDNACSQDSCVASKCVYQYVTGCCGSAYECGPSEACLDPNTPTAKCAACQADLDCDDADPCTVDTCNAQGQCSHAGAPGCCSKPGDKCDDGLACTVDSCDVAAGKCKHVQPAGVCCNDAECQSNDVCKVGACVDAECRYSPDVFKPGCCSAGSNPTCDDKNVCTIDKCEIDKGTWTQCSHTVPANQQGVCCVDSNDCVDGDGCTADVCIGNKCAHPVIGDCCKVPLDCDDGNSCTVDACTVAPGQATGQCSHAKTPGCCNSHGDCNDNQFCTADSCNFAASKCVHVQQDANCCDTDSQCADDKACNVDACINHVCLHGPDVFKPDCCDSGADCNDGKPCTFDTCNSATKLCVYAPNGDGTCCNSALDCDDGDCTTVDFCDTFAKCKYAPAVDKCKADIDCDDGLPCTTDSCTVTDGCGSCQYTPQPASVCCQADYDCNDGKVCTADKCVANKCQNSAKADCCIDDQDALTACDDGNACTVDYCLANQCRHTAPKNGCCATAGDCNDGDKCTIDSCTNIDAGSGVGTCQSVKDPANPTCACTDSGVLAGTDCNDNDLCTQDSCNGGACKHTQIAGCCLDKFDCDDGSPCTFDYCLYNECAHTTVLGQDKLCCSKENEAVECASFNSECAVGKCKDQPDGGTKCVAEPLPVCNVELGWCQDFADGQSLPALGWNPGDIQATASKNWSLAKTGGLGPDQHARLSWTPTVVNFDTCLQSPVIAAAGAKTITLQYDHEYIENVGDVTLRVLGSLEGENVNWANATVIDVKTPTQQQGPETLDVLLPPELTNSNGLRIAFCASGPSTFNLTSWSLDNVCIVKGSKPKFAPCPANQIMPYNTKKLLPIKASDPDAALNILTYTLVEAPEFVWATGALYFWLDNTWNATIGMLPNKLEHVGTHQITAKVSDGGLYSLCTFDVTVTYPGGHLVWRPAEVPAEAGDAIFQALEAKNLVTQHVTDLGLYPDLSKFQAIWVSLGVYPNNHVLTEQEGEKLAAYLAKGGRLYVEGGDTWFFDAQTPLHALLQVDAVADGLDEGISAPLLGQGPYKDMAQTPVKTFGFGYSDDPTWNNLNDVIKAKNVAGVRDILRHDGVTPDAWLQVANDAPGGYRTVASSLLVGGVVAGPDEGKDMVGRVLHFFDNGFVDCLQDEHCDDGDACTKDTCAPPQAGNSNGGKCSYAAACSCVATQTLGCGGSVTMVSNGAGSTDVVSSYSCDPGGTWAGNETSVKVTSATSKPVTLTVSGLSDPKARVFVMRAAGNGCENTQCLAMGTATLKFAAAAGETYYVVLDAPEGTVAQAKVDIACGTGEDCTNGADDDGNGLFDCNDLASCCGDAACGEVCNGADDDCDAVTDEACDDDGDDWCDAGMTTIGKPPVCPNGGGDCNDASGTVFPTSAELCGNAVDDDCDGQTDEEDATGCKPHFADLDGDGFGTGAARCLCGGSGAYTATKPGDCNDGNPAVSPAGQETCGNGLDDDCSGSQNDLGALGCVDFYVDNDGDTWGTTPKKCLCEASGPHKTKLDGDCNDVDAQIYPGVGETCNGKDDDCDGDVDEGCDDDGDGWCDAALAKASGTLLVCPNGGGDCDDEAGGVHPGAAETCNAGVDDDCDGVADDMDALGCIDFYADVDGDNFGTPSTSACLCAPTGSYTVNNGLDCQDNDGAIHPLAAELCDGIDNDCSGLPDEGCAAASVEVTFACAYGEVAGPNHKLLLEMGGWSQAGSAADATYQVDLGYIAWLLVLVQ